MTKLLVRQSFIQIQDPESEKQKQKTPNFFFLTPPCSGGSPPNFA